MSYRGKHAHLKGIKCGVPCGYELSSTVSADDRRPFQSRMEITEKNYFYAAGNLFQN